jgi:hypothetical protein
MHIVFIIIVITAITSHSSQLSLFTAQRTRCDVYNMKSLLLLLTSLTLLIPQVLAWGADGKSITPSNQPTNQPTYPPSTGHKIVATIAQVHLHPNTKKALLNILPPEAKGHLAFVAAWADQVRARFPATGPMHYINRQSQEGNANGSDENILMKAVS